MVKIIRNKILNAQPNLPKKGRFMLEKMLVMISYIIYLR